MFGSPFVSPFISPYGGKLQQPIQQQVVRPQPQLPPENSLPRVVNYLADYSGCGHWRVLWPEQILNANQQLVSQSNTCMIFDPRWYEGVTAVKIQRQATSEQKKFIEYLKTIQSQCGFKIIYEVDDVVFKECIPDYNRFKFAFDTEEIRQNCIDIINLADEVTVTCDYMKELYMEKTGKKEITVIPNFPPFFWMGYLFNHSKICTSLDRNHKKPRILYTGSGAHYDVDNKTGGKDDFEHVVKAIIDTRHKYQWVFMGAFPPPLGPYIKSGEIEFHPWQPLYQYPKKIYELDINLMIAPLQDNPFNKSKSDIKYIEACILGIPVICQNIVTYKDAMLKFNSGDELLDMIASTLKNKPKYRKMSLDMRAVGETRFLENQENVGCVYEAYTTPFNSEKRKHLTKWN
jgi:hypothetical protein